MKKDNSKIPYDSYLESFERIRKSLMPLNKTLSKRIFDTSSLTGSMQCFRHASNDAVNERKTYTDKQKYFLIDFGLTIVKVIYEFIKLDAGI